jgi:hypothetical protein
MSTFGSSVFDALSYEADFHSPGMIEDRHRLGTDRTGAQWTILSPCGRGRG